MGPDGVSFNYSGNRYGAILYYTKELKKLTPETKGEELSLRRGIMQSIADFPTYTEYTQAGGNQAKCPA